MRGNLPRWGLKRAFEIVKHPKFRWKFTPLGFETLLF